MKRIDVTCGYREEYPNGDIYYYGGETAQGVVYKDMDAWASGEGVCYINELAFDEDINELSSDENWCYKNYQGNTRDEIIADMAEYLPSCDVKFIEQCAEYVLQTCDWECLTTMMIDVDWDEDIKDLLTEGTDVCFIPVVNVYERHYYKIANEIEDLDCFLIANEDHERYASLSEVYRKSDKVCKHCGGPLYHEKYDNTRDHYPYFCPECDENFFGFEAR